MAGVHHLTALNSDQTRAVLEELLNVYLDVYREPPYNSGPIWHADEFLTRTQSQIDRQGFSCITARVSDGSLIGFSFGFTFPADKWWSGANLPPIEILAAEKLAVIELVVLKGFRNLGIGRELLDALLGNRTEAYATLAAVSSAPARQIYKHWGWIQVGDFDEVPGEPHFDALALPLFNQPIN